jgi:GcrA cell cycle regulator
MDWSEERTAVLKKLWLEGLSASQVARQLGGVSRSAVIGKVHRLGITAREAPVRTRSASVRVPGRTTVRPQVVRTATPASPRAPIRVAVELSATSNILGLEVHSCRWPIGNPDQNDFGFCGREKLARGSYCDLHAQGAFRRCLSRVELDAWAQGASAGRRLQQSRP